MIAFDEKYWSCRYNNGQTQWDAGKITRPIKEFFDQLSNDALEILIPGGGNGHEAAYLHEKGFPSIYLLDFSHVPLENFQKKYPDFPPDHLLQQNFFDLNQKFDLIVEQTFFCALDPSLRSHYAKKAAEVLKPGGKLVGVLFEGQLNEGHPPFGGTKEEYLEYFEPFFSIQKMERCYNSIQPRQGRELWIELVLKNVE